MIRSRLIVTKQTPLAARGLVTAEHPLGAEVGGAVLARGGNAIDAALATAFAMTVVEPFMSTIAGSGTMLVHLAKRGETVALDFNAVAPLAAHERLFPLIGGVSDALFPWPRVADDANVFGHRSVAVPGSIAGLALALSRWGTMDWRDVIAPAIALARDGFVPDWYLAVNMVPVLAFRGGVPYLTLGAPGGRKIVSAIPQVLSNLADLGCSPQAAIEAPRVHSEGPAVEVDDRVGDTALAGLRRRGHDVLARTETYSTLNFARPIAIRVTRKGLEAGLDHLGDAAAAGH